MPFCEFILDFMMCFLLELLLLAGCNWTLSYGGLGLSWWLAQAPRVSSWLFEGLQDWIATTSRGVRVFRIRCSAELIVLKQTGVLLSVWTLRWDWALPASSGSVSINSLIRAAQLVPKIWRSEAKEDSLLLSTYFADLILMIFALPFPGSCKSCKVTIFLRDCNFVNSYDPVLTRSLSRSSFSL